MRIAKRTVVVGMRIRQAHRFDIKMYVRPQKRPCQILNTDRISRFGGFIWREAGLKDGAMLKLNPARMYLEDVGAP